MLKRIRSYIVTCSTISKFLGGLNNMCIAIWKPAEVSISRDVLKTCFDNNDHGAGFAYINTDIMGKREIKIRKTMNFEVFYRKYTRAVRMNPDSPFIIHFRIATHGTVDAYNCHPFKVNEDLVFAHNGVIHKATKDARKSDTQMFNMEILKKINHLELMWNPAVKVLIENYIGSTNKLILMDIDGEVNIFNEGAGNWHEGAWYSNLSWKPRAVYYPVKVEKKDNLFKYKRDRYNINYEKCSCCSRWFDTIQMTTYRKGLEIHVVCDGCNEEYTAKWGLTEMDIYDMSPSQYEQHFTASMC
jgi:glutamine amidotransferase